MVFKNHDQGDDSSGMMSKTPTSKFLGKNACREFAIYEYELLSWWFGIFEIFGAGRPRRVFASVHPTGITERKKYAYWE
jgi:hypothetical protein